MVMTTNITATPELDSKVSVRSSGMLVRFLLTVVAVLGGILVIRYWVDYAAEQDPTCRHIDNRWVYKAETLASIAMQCLGEGEDAKAKDYAKTALARQPMNQLALVTLGSTADLRGDLKNADLWYQLASKLSHRDYSVETYWTEQSLKRGDVVSATNHLDALLRSGWSDTLSREMVLQLESKPTGRQALAQIMAKRPLWYTSYLTNISELTESQLQHRTQLLRLIAGQIKEPEYKNFLYISAPMIEALYNNKKFESAYTLRSAMQPFPTNVGIRDPHFTALAGRSAGPFDWRRGDDASLDLKVRQGRTGPAGIKLIVTDEGRYLVAVQTVRLTPGVHELRLDGNGEARAGGNFVVKLEGVEHSQSIEPQVMPIPRANIPSQSSFLVSGRDQYFRLTLWLDWRASDELVIDLNSLTERPK